MLNIRIQLIKHSTVSERKRVDIHYSFWDGCPCATERRHCFLYTDDPEFDAVKYIVDTYHSSVDYKVKFS